MEIIPLKLTATNCFLVKTGEQYVLIDTGYEIDWNLFCKRLQEVGVNFSQISHIILTHHHDDHCGLFNYILTKNDKIRIVMAASAKDLLIKGENDFTHGYYFINKRIKVLVRSMKRFFLMITAKKHIAKESNLKFPPYWVRGNDILITKEAKLIEIGINLKGRIIETPGHTIDSISVLLDDGNCFVGDAAANLLRFAGTKYCVIGICDLEEYYRSWQRILEEGAKHIFPAHGKPFAAEKLRENIGKNKKKNMVMIRSRINE